MAKKQPSFSDLDYDNKKKTTRKDLFLQKMNEVIPWEVLLKPIRREYPQGAFRSPADSVREDATDILHATMVSFGRSGDGRHAV